MNQFGKFAEKIGILVQGGTVNVGQIRLDSEMSRQELRNRKALLNNVRTAWVEGVLEKSLHEQIPIVLGLENRPSAVASPWNLDLINPNRSCQPLPAGTPVIDVFDKLGEGGTLLILGEPGSGKTITLLQLARDLIARAEEKIDRRIPVVLNLSSWAAEKQTIAKWIVEELNSKYQVNRKIGQQWVEKQELLLLLDGLDEIWDLEKRNACVMALNAFQQDQATEMVVCCRMRDYQRLRHQLKLQSALVLQPLANNQIHSYLDCLQLDLTVLKIMLIEDKALGDLALYPLLLNIMVLAYQGIKIAGIPINTLNSNRKRQLFNDYINRIFHGSRPFAYHPNFQSQEKQLYTRQDSTHWLIWMAQKMILSSQSIFLIENINAYWLSSTEIIYYQIGTLLSHGLIVGLPLLPYYWLNSWVYFSVPNFYSAYFFLPYFSGLVLSVMIKIVLIKEKKSKSLESMRWSWDKFKDNFIRVMLCGQFSSLILFLIMIYPALISWSTAIMVLLVCEAIGLFFGLFFGLVEFEGLNTGFKIIEVDAKSYLNQDIRNSAINSLIIGLICGLIGVLVSGIFYGLTFWLREFGLIFGLNRLIIGLIFGLIIGLIGLVFGGFAHIKYLVLCLILYFTGHIPWNYAKFLDWASDKLFLQKVGGGYIFIHRSLMEHFAEMENG